MQMYGKSCWISHLFVHCLGWFYLMTSIGSSWMIIELKMKIRSERFPLNDFGWRCFFDQAISSLKFL